MTTRPAHHPTLPPSSFPMFAQCPCFKSADRQTDEMSEGVRQHEVLADLLRNPNKVQPRQDEPARDAILWARDFIVTTLSGSNLRAEDIERSLIYVDDNFIEVTFGTSDVCVVMRTGPHIIVFDYKSGATGNHGAQLRLYALMAMRKWGAATATCYTLYGATQYAHTEEVDIISCQKEFDEIRAAVEDPNKQPSRCDHCDWCESFETCPAVTHQVYEIARAESLDVSSPLQIAEALEVAKVAKKWAESIEAKAKAAIIDGAEVPGWRIQEGKPTNYVADIPKAFALAGIDQTEFLAACSASLPKLADIIAKRDDMSQKAARDALENLIAAALGQKAGSTKLVRAKGK